MANLIIIDYYTCNIKWIREVEEVSVCINIEKPKGQLRKKFKFYFENNPIKNFTKRAKISSNSDSK